MCVAAVGLVGGAGISSIAGRFLADHRGRSAGHLDGIFHRDGSTAGCSRARQFANCCRRDWRVAGGRRCGHKIYRLHRRRKPPCCIFLGDALLASRSLRNFVWTGDPFFPFTLRWFSPGRINTYALTSLLGDTGTSGHVTFWQLAKFPFLAAIDPDHLGFWQFFGPLCLIFAPLIVLAIRNTPLWRTAIIVWLASSIAIGASSGMTRFLLPVLPIALAAAIAGATALSKMEWRIARSISAASIAVFLLLGAAGFAMYARPALAAAAGLTTREDYLRQRAPDYAVSEFVNQTIAGEEAEGNALIFFRHVYYLRIPFLFGDPQASWAVDPARLATPEAWREFFRQNRIRWVVRSPEYPEEIAVPLEQLERSGSLTPIAHQDVATLEGMRILGIHKTVTAVVLQVND